MTARYVELLKETFDAMSDSEYQDFIGTYPEYREYAQKINYERRPSDERDREKH